MAHKTDEGTEPVIDLTVMKAFFKALDDAPDDRVAYANRFMDKDAEPLAQRRKVSTPLSGRATLQPRCPRQIMPDGSGNAVAAPRPPVSSGTSQNLRGKPTRSGACTSNKQQRPTSRSWRQ
jgi:hypothetical protein